MSYSLLLWVDVTQETLEYLWEDPQTVVRAVVLCSIEFFQTECFCINLSGENLFVKAVFLNDKYLVKVGLTFDLTRLANMLLLDILCEEVEEELVEVNIFCPDSVATALAECFFSEEADSMSSSLARICRHTVLPVPDSPTSMIPVECLMNWNSWITF